MLTIQAQRQQGQFALNVDIVAGPGVTALFGKSGSGKTSIINMVAGLSRPDRGRIAVDDRVLYDSATGIDLPPDRRRLGYVFQDSRLFPHLTVHGNLSFGMNRLPPRERRVGFDDVVDVLGISGLLDRRPALLSGGEKQRVAIGRALLASPRILLMDEPLASLDGSRKDELLPFIAGLSQTFDIPILYVSHAMDEVLRLADTLALIDDGRVAAIGAVEDLLSRPDLRPLTGRYEAGAVVRATVAEHDIDHGVTRLDFAGGTLIIQALPDLPTGSPVRARIHARDISIALDPPGRVSLRNILPARIKEIRPIENHLVDIILDCGGAPLWAQITTLGMTQLALQPGQNVHAMIKAVTIARGDVAGRHA